MQATAGARVSGLISTTTRLMAAWLRPQSGLQRFAKPGTAFEPCASFAPTGLAVTKPLELHSEALEDADFFLLLASPQAAQSKWVEQEVAWWLQNRSASRLLIVWTEGELAWNRAAADFDWATTMPAESLRKAFEHDRCSGFRWARSGADLSLRHPKFAGHRQLAATLQGKSVDELLWRKKAMRWLRFALLALLLTVLALFAVVIAVDRGL
jgi:hypothetical protein